MKNSEFSVSLWPEKTTKLPSVFTVVGSSDSPYMESITAAISSGTAKFG